MGITADLDAVLRDLGFLAEYHRDFHPANTGDVSQILEPGTAEALLARFRSSASDWYHIANLEQLAEIRRDGRAGYRSSGIKTEAFFQFTQALAGRVCLITCTGSQVPAINQTIAASESGKLLNVIEIDEAGRRIRILYGNHQFGTIPSIETHVHLMANGMEALAGEPAPATVHAHPFHLVTLGRHRRVGGDFASFNAALYTSIEGINRNHFDLVGVVPYFESGSAALLENTIEALRRHALVLWMNHGFVVRAANVRRAYTLLSYAEEAARAAIVSLDQGASGLPDGVIGPFLAKHGLVPAYERLFESGPN